MKVDVSTINAYLCSQQSIESTESQALSTSTQSHDDGMTSTETEEHFLFVTITAQIQYH